jgi:hypothetical protein
VVDFVRLSPERADSTESAEHLQRTRGSAYKTNSEGCVGYDPLVVKVDGWDPGSGESGRGLWNSKKGVEGVGWRLGDRFLENRVRFEAETDHWGRTVHSAGRPNDLSRP